MPTITNTSSFAVTVKASKAGYKTQTTTQTVRVNKAAGTLILSATSGTLMYPDTTTFTASGNKGTLSVVSSNTNVATVSISGNTVTVKSGSTAGTATITVTSAATANYNEKSVNYNVIVYNIDSLKIGDYVNYTYDTAEAYTIEAKYSGYDSDQSVPQSTGLKWRILNIDKTNGTVDIINKDKTSTRVSFKGILGYNNGPYLMNEVCKAQYSNKTLGTYARSINLLDMEKHLTKEGISARNDFMSNLYVQYGKTKTYTGSTIYYYPVLYKNQKGAGINGTSIIQLDITKGNDPYEESKPIATIEPTTDSSYGQMPSSGITLTQTYYYMEINSENYGEAGDVLRNTAYWIASRCTEVGSNVAYWGLRFAGSYINNVSMFSVSNSITGSERFLRPVVSLKSNIFTGDKDSSGAWNLK